MQHDTSILGEELTKADSRADVLTSTLYLMTLPFDFFQDKDCIFLCIPGGQ